MHDACGNMTVEFHPDALIVRGYIPVDGLFSALVSYAEVYGWDLMDIGLGQAIGATLVATNAAGSARLRAEHEAGITDTDPVTRWLRGVDTGVSSRTMVEAMVGSHVCHQERPDVPHDPADLGRCIRLLEACPHLRPRLHLVAERFPEGVPYIEHWEELEALYRQEIPDLRQGEAPRTYARMKELRTHA